MAHIEKQFEDAFRRHGDELFRFAYLRVSDRERALDLVQETFLRTWRHLAQGRPVREYRPFLYMTLRHLVIDEYRRHKTLSLEAMIEEDDGEALDSRLPKDDTNTLEAAIDRLDGRRAVDCLARLPQRYRETLIMRYIDGLSPQEIAACLGERENAVSVRIHRGLKKLSALLEPASHHESI